MSLIIFFGLAFFITVVGFAYSFLVIRHHWQKTETYKKWNKEKVLPAVTNKTAIDFEAEKKSHKSTNQEMTHPSISDSVKAKELLLFLLFFTTFCFSFKSAARIQTELRPSLRTYPTGFSVTATAKDDFLIWDQRDQQFWQFGLIKPQISVATHGQIEAGVSLYPISFFELFSSVAWTNRYYDTKPFDCDAYQCQGTVQRKKMGARLALQFSTELGEILVVPTYQQTQLEGDNKKTIVDEEEVLLAHAEWDSLSSQSLFVGFKRERQTTGLYYKQSQFQRYASRNQSEYLIHQFKYTYPKLDKPFDVVVGVGRYYSDYSAASFSAIAALSWRWGDSLALF